MVYMIGVFQKFWEREIELATRRRWRSTMLTAGENAPIWILVCREHDNSRVIFLVTGCVYCCKECGLGIHNVKNMKFGDWMYTHGPKCPRPEAKSAKATGHRLRIGL